MFFCFRKLFKFIATVTIMARKISGGKYRKARKRKLAEIPGKPRVVKLGKEKKKHLRIRGGKMKVVLLSTDKANVFDPKTKKAKLAKIQAVLEIPANRFLENVLIKGTIIQTEIGKAKIINRPGQEGCVQAILVE